MNLQTKPVYRNELKYFINKEQYILLRERLKHIFKQDATGKQEYNIRSLYFDDFLNSAASDKYSGALFRKKYRIRCYNGLDNVIKLEKKVKREQYVHKEVELISLETYEKLVTNQVSQMAVKGQDLLSEWLYLMKNQGLSPKIIVDYNREAFVLREGEVRITFDKDLSVARPGCNLFDLNLPKWPALSGNISILEVKFTGILPSILRDVLQVGSLEKSSISKYILCLEKIKKLGGILNV